MKVGDGVRVRKDCGYTGREAKVINVRWELFTLDIDGGFWLWSKNELELIEEPKPKLKVGDWVKIKETGKYEKIMGFAFGDFCYFDDKPCTLTYIDDLEILPQVGDEVTVLKGQKTRGMHFTSEMLEFIGKKAIITTLKTGGCDKILYKLDVDNESWYWIPEWLSLTNKNEEDNNQTNKEDVTSLVEAINKVIFSQFINDNERQSLSEMLTRLTMTNNISHHYPRRKANKEECAWGDCEMWFEGIKIENIAKKIEYKDEEAKEKLENDIDALIKDFEVNNNAKLISYEKPKFEIKYEI